MLVLFLIKLISKLTVQLNHDHEYTYVYMRVSLWHSWYIYPRRPCHWPHDHDIKFFQCTGMERGRFRNRNAQTHSDSVNIRISNILMNNQKSEKFPMIWFKSCKCINDSLFDHGFDNFYPKISSVPKPKVEKSFGLLSLEVWTINLFFNGCMPFTTCLCTYCRPKYFWNIGGYGDYLMHSLWII